VSGGEPPDPRAPRSAEDREQRLLEIRRQAESHAKVEAPGVRPPGAPFPQASPTTGYYGVPLLKEPAWTPEVPLYFFVGGIAGAAAVVGAVAHYTGADRRLVRDARWIAAAGAILSPPLLIADLGRPERFLGMLRVFKPRSPMSVGAWTLLGFSGATAATAFAGFLRERYGQRFPVRVLENAGQAASLAFGLPFSNYTGVLLGATAIPVWNENAGNLPIHFGASGLGAAVSLLELLGHGKHRALRTLALGAALFECWEGWRIEDRSLPGLDPLKHGHSGWMIRTGGVLSGPVPLLLRTLASLSRNERQERLQRWAGMATIAGSLLTRIAWVQAGHASARDYRVPLEIEPAE
jgi:hypothetical protein